MLCKEGEGTDLMLWNMTSPVHFCTSSGGRGSLRISVSQDAAGDSGVEHIGVAT